MKRARALANQRAAEYSSVAERIAICPLSIHCQRNLPTTAGGTKYTFGLEMGGCAKQLETRPRSTVVRALW